MQNEQLTPAQAITRRKAISYLVEQEHPQSREMAAALTAEWETQSYADILAARRYNRKQQRRLRKQQYAAEKARKVRI